MPDISAGFLSLLILMFWGLVCYGAYRVIKGGFERSQSERLNGYGIFGTILLLLLLVWTVAYFLT